MLHGYFSIGLLQVFRADVLGDPKYFIIITFGQQGLLPEDAKRLLFNFLVFCINDVIIILLAA